MSLTPLTPGVHAPDDYVKLYTQFIESLSVEAGLLNQVRHSYENEPIGKTISATRLNLLRKIQVAHLEREAIIKQLIGVEFDLLEFQKDDQKVKEHL